MQPTAEQFAADVAQHEMTILHKQGVYRHVTFGRPGCGIDRFNLTTFPGYLVFTGDRGDYLFERTDDMFAFFRGDRINPGYWAEKCMAADRDGIKRFSADVFRERLRECLDDMEASEDLREEVEGNLLTYVDDLDDATAHYNVANFGTDGCDQVFCDSHELDFTEYTYRFIWCLRAIVWGIAKYDASRSE